jgi:hypothetical protein
MKRVLGKMREATMASAGKNALAAWAAVSSRAAGGSTTRQPTDTISL